MKTLCRLLVLLLCVTLCGCTEAQKQATTNPPQLMSPGEGTAEGKTVYTVTVVDESGAPISGAMVQLCLDACYPGVTDANGQAKYTVEEADYKVSFLTLPAGYTYSGDAREFCFEKGSFDLTVTLKAVP